MDGLHSPAAERRAVLARLPGLLLHVARHEAGRRNEWLHVSCPVLDDLAQQAAADALRTITAQLGGFRGQSRFSSWASKFVVCSVSEAAGRRFWQTRTISLDQEDWDRPPSCLQPHERAERNELVSALRRAVHEDLSGEQRRVFTAVTLHGVPAAALPTVLGSSRNATYKALFEARRILRARLAADERDLAHLSGAPVTGPPWLDDLLAADPGDAGCDLAFHVLDRYTEAELNRTGPASRFPGVAIHLRHCEVCRQDYQGLLAAVAGQRVCAVTDVRTACGGCGFGPVPGLKTFKDHQRLGGCAGCLNRPAPGISHPAGQAADLSHREHPPAGRPSAAGGDDTAVIACTRW
jgi:RNA polymerase sigma-70 factor (ECF subfamily)